MKKLETAKTISNTTMKKSILTLMAIALLSTSTMAQYKLNLAAGFQGFGFEPTGYLLEFEYEKYYRDDFSAPLRADLIYAHSKDYEAVSLDIHKGFRKYFSNGLILEQAVGAGIITSFYNSDYIWSYDKYTNVVFHYNKPAIGFTRSVTLGVAYDLTKNAEKSNLIWVPMGSMIC
jgi:hypothetical protein